MSTSSTGTWFNVHDDKPLRPSGTYVIFSAEERPKLRLEFPNMSFREYAPRLSARFKALPPTEREKYNKKALLDKERFVRETLERKNEIERRILLLAEDTAQINHS
uniref:HMG box domain-containing protein n=1 Tax=Chaetoceros debilis TaxID=122233 RepID=A0A7S3QH47_9STRA